MFKFIAVCSFLLIVSACGETKSKGGGPMVLNNGINNGTDDAGDVGNNGETDATSLPDLIMEEGGPVYVNLSVTPMTLTEGGTVSIITQLTDPDGFDDIGGGRLLDADGNVYGNFNGSGGSYDLMLTWDQINGVELISFETSKSLSFIVEFFDASGLKSQQALSLELNCDGAPACEGGCGPTFCGGECINVFDTIENCGGCGVVCDGAQNEFCIDEACKTVVTKYLDVCETGQDCGEFGNQECLNFFDEPNRRCIAFCGSDEDCFGGGKCLDDYCAVDCSANASICTGTLSCVDFGNGLTCQPTFN